MLRQIIHQCGCPKCTQGNDSVTAELHAQLNLFLSTLDENKRLQFLGMESMNPGYGGDQQLEVITGVKATVIAKMRWSIEYSRINQQQFGDVKPSYRIKEPYRPWEQQTK